MLRTIFLLGLLTVGCMAFGQNYNAEKVDRPNTKKINFGIKAGFNSSMFLVSKLKIKDVTIDEVQNNYKIWPNVRSASISWAHSTLLSNRIMHPYNLYCTVSTSLFYTVIML